MKNLNVSQSKLEKVLGPAAGWLNENRFITALSQGFMGILPVTLGVAIIAILINFPIDAWKALLTQVGLYAVGQEFISTTLSLLAVYVVGSIGYNFAKNDGKNGMIGSILSLATFITLIPLDVVSIKEAPVSVIRISYLGSDGFFVAMLCGLLIPYVYCKLTDLKLVLKLPDSVPPMVSKSLAPTFTSMIIFTGVFFIKYFFKSTSFGDVFTMVTTVIAKPIMQFGATPISLIVVFTLINLFWFFGIHPNAVLSCYMPVLIATSIANQSAYAAGNAMPYITFALVGSVVQIGGAGNTLGLCIATLFAKSEKYKALRKLVIPANIFNINEPVIFGFPIVMNPIYFIPMVLTPIASGLITIFMLNIVPVTLNPFASLATMPWVTPIFVVASLQGGLAFLLIFIICVLAHFLIYLPFFKMDDANAYRLELENQETIDANSIKA
ncbi:PTS transporter subunit EIIC [Clostridium sp. YIM B02555]|uniref:PTS sugar transporter subunit IIC n=1 Tax=Clostridium sp. YIM B02555 TaxID=2911968 RepID=UPI001EEE0416|nr:PTS transporter subunit EIIC [Clostridium sp. YIM B02555]